MIYDGGDTATSSFVVVYLKDQGVTDIDYLISSHYNSDHLAGLIGCLNAFNVDTVIGSDYEHDSKLYDSFMNAVADKGLEVQHPAVGTEFKFGSEKFTVLSPASIGTDSNANSIIIKLKNGENSFLLTGDAEHNAEAVMCSSGLDLESDVYRTDKQSSIIAVSDGQKIEWSQEPCNDYSPGDPCVGSGHTTTEIC